jgi:hypothetical protein
MASSNDTTRPCSTSSTASLPQENLRNDQRIAKDLDVWMTEYNEARPHQGRYCFGKDADANFP